MDDNELMGRVIIPLIQSFILSVIGAVLGAIFTDLIGSSTHYLAPFVGIVFASIWLFYSFRKTIPPEVIIENAEDTDTFVAEEQESQDGNPDNKNIQISLTSQDGRQGSFYGIVGFPLVKLEQIAFHVAYCGGTLAHAYLDEKKGILNRAGVTQLQTVLVEQKLAQEKSYGNKKCGVELTDNGREVFRQLALSYLPSPTDKKDMIKFLRNQKRELHTQDEHTQNPS